MPQQLLLQEADGVQREDDGFVFQQTVDVQPCTREDRRTLFRVVSQKASVVMRKINTDTKHTGNLSAKVKSFVFQMIYRIFLLFFHVGY